jgi:hypothetical protein
MNKKIAWTMYFSRRVLLKGLARCLPAALPAPPKR